MTEEITIEVTPGARLDKSGRDEILSLCTMAYETDFVPVMRSYGGATTHVLLRAGVELVSHALWVTRWLQAGSEPPMRTAYVEALATSPIHRGRGYASSVMRRIADEIVDFEIGGLSPSDHQFYERLGWERWIGTLFIRKAADLLATPPGEDVMILRLPKSPKLNLGGPLSVEWREGEVW
jgi:aminoglycoside 2'-N-acetyltransferase I